MSQLLGSAIDLLEHVDDKRLRLTMNVANAANRFRIGFTENISLGAYEFGLSPNWTGLSDHDRIG